MKLGFAEIFKTGMVLQRDREVAIWGSAQKGQEIALSLFDAENGTIITSVGATADDNETWKVTLPKTDAGCGFEICLECKDTNEAIVLKDVCFGDVWLAGGQSNMEFFLKYDADFESVNAKETNPNIRMFNVPQRAFEGHNSRNKKGYGYWFVKGDVGFESFSAPAYSFACNIQPVLDIPIGLIGCNWGGSSASTWVPESVLSQKPLDIYLKEYEDACNAMSEDEMKSESMKALAFEESDENGESFAPLLYGRDREWQLDYIKKHAGDPVMPMGPFNFNRPGALFEYMLRPIIPYGIKGVLWYQGESDAGYRAPMYDILQTKLIECWRKEWQYDFPFIMVQLAPFGIWLECTNDDYCVVRQKQEYVADNVSSVYMASIMDIGSYYDIHPKKKMEVGRRLALLARANVYGEDEKTFNPPRVTGAKLDGNEVIIDFDYAEGLHRSEGATDIEIICNDKAIKVEEFAVKDEKVIVTLPKNVSTDSKLYVQMGWADYAEINIHNKSGVCMCPFSVEIMR